jgi:hypothetical protein
VLEKGSLVTWHHGFDVASKAMLAGLDAFWIREQDKKFGILGEYLEILVCRKPCTTL